MRVFRGTTLVGLFIGLFFTVPLGSLPIYAIHKPIRISIPADSVGRISLQEFTRVHTGNTKWTYQTNANRVRWQVNLNLTERKVNIDNLRLPEPQRLSQRQFILPPMRLTRGEALGVDNKETRVYVAASDGSKTRTIADYNQESIRFREQERDERILRGPIRVDSSSPLLPGYQLSAHWEGDGGEIVPGKVTLEPEAEYEVYPAHSGGQIVVTMTDDQGQTVARSTGRGGGSSKEADENPKEVVVRDRKAIVASFSVFGSDGRTDSAMMSFSPKAKHIPQTEVTANGDEETLQTVSEQDGTYTIGELDPNSWVILRSQTPGYSGTVSIHQAGDRPQIPLFANSFVSAMNEIVFEKPGAPESMVIGQVVNQGNPKSGYIVSIADTTVTSEVIYLNELLIPDRNLTSTSKNGFFVILNLERGFYPLRAQSETAPEMVTYGNVYVEQEFVAPITLELPRVTDQKPSIVAVYDAFTGEPAVATVQFQSLPEPVEIVGQGTINQTYQSTQFFQAFVDQGSDLYAPSLTPYSSHYESEVRIPLLQKRWVEYVIATTRTNLEPDTGMLVVFNGSATIEGGQDLRQIYFSPTGEIVPQPVSGGGFILVNLKPDLFLIKVNQTNYRLAPVESGVITVVPPTHL